eukprot:TRINITY_DN5567_c0_g1_i1.p2 TRINITY_DN5567_c0_g1~~TRINITY_DN5567_c0_g1_i1.p2  ORF type:complete len:224 (-),score=39.46 TRINITY_DN5567_c0_g1_i1:203-874(-)
MAQPRGRAELQTSRMPSRTPSPEHIVARSMMYAPMLAGMHKSDTVQTPEGSTPRGHDNDSHFQAAYGMSPQQAPLGTTNSELQDVGYATEQWTSNVAVEAMPCAVWWIAPVPVCPPSDTSPHASWADMEDSDDEEEEAESCEAAHMGSTGSTEVTDSPSVGSAGHPFTCGAPCKYHSRSKGCKDGARCDHCHLCPYKRPPAAPPPSHAQRRPRYRRQRKAAKQ